MMGRIVLAAVIVTMGCAAEPEDACDACTPRPPSTLFLSDRGTNAILRYDGVTGQFEDVFAAGAEQRVDRPAGLRLGPTGHVYSAGFGRGDVVRYDPASGRMMDVFYWDTTALEEPVELLFRGDELLVLGNDTKNVVAIDPAGTYARELGYPMMRAAHDMTLASDGRTLYVATDSHPELGSAVQIWDVVTGELRGHFGRTDELAMATGLALRGDGTLYVCDWERGTVQRFDPATGSLLATVMTGLTAPVALDIGPDGALYVLDAVGLHRVDPDSGNELRLLVATDDGHNKQPRAFTFMTETAIEQAIARIR